MTLPVVLMYPPAKPDEPVCGQLDDLYGFPCIYKADHWHSHRALDPDDDQFQVVWSNRK